MTEKIQRLIDAIDRLDRNDPAHFTGSGVPSANVLKELIGESVSAAERDEAWALYQEQAGGADQQEQAARPVDLTGATAVVTMIGGKAQQVWFRDGKQIHVGPAPE